MTSLFGEGLFGVGLFGVDGSPFAVIGGSPLVGTAYNPEAGSLNIESAIGRRSTASCTIRIEAPMYFPEDSQISLYNGAATLIFAGYLSAPKYHKPGFDPGRYHQLSARDKHWLADKRRIAASFENKTGRYIALYLHANVLAGEGVTIGQIYEDNTINDNTYCSETRLCGEAIGVIPSIAFDYSTIAEDFDAIVKNISSSGVPFYWQIDYEAQLWLVAYTAVVNSVVIDGTTVDEVVNPPEVTRTNPRYRNTQIMTGGTIETTTQNETRKGDGDTQAWPMRYALSRVPTITVNSASKTVGIRGVDTGKNFYWSKGEFEITQESGDTKLTSSDTLAVAYTGLYKNTAIVSNDAQIALQASIDGSSGIVEEKEDIALSTLEAQLSVGGSRLTRYAVQSPPIFEFTTRDTGYQPGQFATVDLPDWSIIEQMLIESVSASDGIDGHNIYYSIKAIAGPSDTSWVAFWGEITGSGGVSSSGSEATTTITTVQQTGEIGASVGITCNPTTFSCPICSESTLCSESTIVC